MAKRKDGVQILRVKDTDDLPAIYAKLKKAFTAADLQKYTEIEPGIPAEQVLAELEAIHREEMEKLQRREEPKELKRKKA